MEKDYDNQSHWIELDKQMMIQGLLAERDKEKETKKLGFMW